MHLICFCQNFYFIPVFQYYIIGFNVIALLSTIGLILLSGYSKILLISSSVGALSSAYLLPLGSPRLIFFQAIGKSLISQNILMVLTEFLRVPPVICFFSTLFFSNCTYRGIFEKAQLVNDCCRY